MISVVIPTYNRGDFIKRAIKSVLNQSYSDLEIIVVDDNSSDNTKDKVDEMVDQRIIYYKLSSNHGPSFCRNYGVDKAKGELIAFLDSDDEWKENKLEMQFNEFKKNPELDYCFCGFEVISSVTLKKIKTVDTNFDLKDNFTNGNFILTPANVTVMMKRDVFLALGGFNENLKAHEDTDLAIRVAMNYNYKAVNLPLVKVYRDHDQLMNNAENYFVAKEYLLKNYKGFLSEKIIEKLNKQLFVYHVMKKNFKSSKDYLNSNLNNSDRLKSLFPKYLLYLFYKIKYRNIPLSSGL